MSGARRRLTGDVVVSDFETAGRNGITERPHLDMATALVTGLVNQQVSNELKAEGPLTELAAELDKTHPGAAASLREGMAETLTILRLGVPPTLARTLRPTDTIESMIRICREHSKNVKRWRDGPWRCAGAPPA